MLTLKIFAQQKLFLPINQQCLALHNAQHSYKCETYEISKESIANF